MSTWRQRLHQRLEALHHWIENQAGERERSSHNRHHGVGTGERTNRRLARLARIAGTHRWDDWSQRDLARLRAKPHPLPPWEGTPLAPGLLPEPNISYAFMASSPFAQAWYKTRELGEHDRAAALHQLYTRRQEPGGAFPDPRADSAFSSRAVVAAAARLAGVRIMPAPDTSNASAADAANTGAKGDASQPDAWLISYPQRAGQQRETAVIVVRSGGREGGHEGVSEHLMLWNAALFLGLLAREPERVRDPNAPAGVTTLPHDPVTIALLHRYAHALLNSSFNCSAYFACACSTIERRLNVPPPDHEQPTTSLPAISMRETPATNPRVTHPIWPDQQSDHQQDERYRRTQAEADEPEGDGCA